RSGLDSESGRGALPRPGSRPDDGPGARIRPAPDGRPAQAAAPPMSGQQSRMHLLSILHAIATLALVAWWSLYFWRHTPAREALLHDDQVSQAHGAQRAAPPGNRGGGQYGSGVRRAIAALVVAGADVAGGLLVLTLFALGTGIYVRRLEIWLHARASGETVMLAGTALDDKALAANATKKGAR